MDLGSSGCTDNTCHQFAVSTCTGIVVLFPALSQLRKIVTAARENVSISTNRHAVNTPAGLSHRICSDGRSSNFRWLAQSNSVAVQLSSVRWDTRPPPPFCRSDGLESNDERFTLRVDWSEQRPAVSFRPGLVVAITSDAHLGRIACEPTVRVGGLPTLIECRVHFRST
jgi:hypothetical protein